jgi:hypothetical protein
MAESRSSPGEWITAASALTPVWGTMVWWPAQTGGHRRGKGGVLLIGVEEVRRGKKGAMAVVASHGEEVGEGPSPTGSQRAAGNGHATAHVGGTRVGGA